MFWQGLGHSQDLAAAERHFSAALQGGLQEAAGLLSAVQDAALHKVGAQDVGACAGEAVHCSCAWQDVAELLLEVQDAAPAPGLLFELQNTALCIRMGSCWASASSCRSKQHSPARKIHRTVDTQQCLACVRGRGNSTCSSQSSHAL